MSTDLNDTGSSANIPGKEAMSPLASELSDYIKLSGPVSLHEYMSQAANHLVHGDTRTFFAIYSMN